MHLSFTDYLSLEVPFTKKFSEDPGILLHFLTILDLGGLKLPMAEIINHYSTIWADKRKTQCDLFFNSWKGLFQYIHFCYQFTLWEHAHGALQNALQGRFSPSIAKTLHNDYLPDQEYFTILVELRLNAHPVARTLLLGLVNLLINDDPDGGYRVGFFYYLWRMEILATIGFAFPKNALLYAPRGKDSSRLHSPSGTCYKYDTTGLLFEICNSIACNTLDQTLEIIDKLKQDKLTLTHLTIFFHALDLLDQLEGILQQPETQKLEPLREVTDFESLEEMGTILAPCLKKIALWRDCIKSLFSNIIKGSSSGFPPPLDAYTWSAPDIPTQNRHVDQDILIQTVNEMNPKTIPINLLHRNIEVLGGFYGILPNPVILNKIKLLQSQLLSSHQNSFPFFTSAIVILGASLTNGNETVISQFWKDFQQYAEKLTPEGRSIVARLLVDYLNTQKFIEVTLNHQQNARNHLSIIEQLMDIYEWVNRSLKNERWPGDKSRFLFPLGLAIARLKKVAQKPNPEHHLTMLLIDFFHYNRAFSEQNPVKHRQSSIEVVKQIALWLSLFVNEDIIFTYMETYSQYFQIKNLSTYKNAFCQCPLAVIQGALGYSELQAKAFDFFTHYYIVLEDYEEIILFTGVITQICQALIEKEQQICFELGDLGDLRGKLNSLQTLNILSRCRYKSKELFWEGA